jgi:hypothetical protein
LTSTNKQNLILGLAAVAILAVIAWVSLRGTGEAARGDAAAKSASVMSPDSFSDERTRAAYQAAKDLPELLEQMPCFCGCLTSFGHDNNLFCFKDQHGAG